MERRARPIIFATTMHRPTSKIQVAQSACKSFPTHAQTARIGCEAAILTITAPAETQKKHGKPISRPRSTQSAKIASRIRRHTRDARQPRLLLQRRANLLGKGTSLQMTNRGRTPFSHSRARRAHATASIGAGSRSLSLWV